jgi:Ice-binding-like
LFSRRRLRHFPLFVFLVMAGSMSATTAGAASPGPVGRGTAGNFAVLGGSTVTNTGASVLTGDLGLSPGTSITGFPPGEVRGAIHQTDAVALQAKQDLVTAYDDAAGRPSNSTISADLGGQTLTPGVYRGAPSLSLTGRLTLDGQGDPNAVFIFQAPASTLITDSASDVILIGRAQACNVVWQVGSSATLGTGSSFTGNILALQSITLNHGATVNGSTLARNAAVTLDQNTISRAACSDGLTSATTGPGGATTATTGPGGGTTSTTGPGGGTTATTGPGGGTTATTGPGGGTRTDTQTDTHTGTRPVVPLASTGAGHAAGRALSGLALAGLGLMMLRVTRRRPAR